MKEYNNYKEFLPDYYYEIREIEALDEIFKAVFIGINSVIVNNMINNRFFNDLDEVGVRKWEKILDINNPMEDTLESRRNAIKAKVQTSPPINMITLQNFIKTYLGVEIIATYTTEPYVVDIRYRGTREFPDLSPFQEKLYELIPANIKVILSYAYTIWQTVGSYTWGQMQQFTWDYVLYDLKENKTLRKIRRRSIR